jgi:DNA polymerase-1
MKSPALRTAKKLYVHPSQTVLFGGLPTHQGDVLALRSVKAQDHYVVVPPNFHYVQTDVELTHCVDRINDAGLFAVDCETGGLRWADHSVAFSITVGHGTNLESWFIPTDMVHALRNFSAAEISTAFASVFADSRVLKVGHNIKFDLHKLEQTYGIDRFAGVHHDTEVAQWVLNENEHHDLESVAQAWLHVELWKRKQDGKFHVWPIKSAVVYACGDTEVTHRLYQFQVPLLTERPKLHSLFYDIEMPTILRVYQMEKNGIAYDIQYHNETLVPFVTQKKAEAEARVRKYTGESVSLASSCTDLAHVVFDGLKLPRQEKRVKCEDGEFRKKITNSLDKNVLSKIRHMHPIVPAIEEYRRYDTVENLFVDKLPGHIYGGKIHPSIHSIGTVTGRMSCTLPNLQQLPKRSVGPIIRRAFVPKPGNILISMDLSQIELRILAHLSEDEAMCDAFRSGKDIHAVTTSRVFGYSMEEIAADEKSKSPRQDLIAARTISKNVNFGIPYGIGPEHLAEVVNADDKIVSKLDKKDCKGFIDSWFEAYPGAQRYIDVTPKIAKANGKREKCVPFVETLLGRKRRLKELYSMNRQIQSSAERKAVNSRIQGSAADFVKLGTLKVADLIDANHWPYQLLLQIHDELLMEVPVAWYMHHQETIQQITHTFQSAIPLIVPVVAKAETLTRWGDRFDEDAFEELDV